jgi:hypothetical protein
MNGMVGGLIQGQHAVRGARSGTGGEDHLRCAFGTGDDAAPPSMERGHAFALGAEGDLADPRPVGLERHGIEAGLGGRDDQRRLGGIALDLEAAVDVSRASEQSAAARKHSITGSAGRIAAPSMVNRPSGV